MRILLVDDHPLFCEALQNLLTMHGYEAVGIAGDGLEALEQARRLHPDLDERHTARGEGVRRARSTPGRI